MRLSRKDEHSITAMLILAQHERSMAPINLTYLSESLGISTSYLEHMFSQLRQYGLVEGLRGIGGGYRLARPASQISIADILCATQALTSEDNSPEMKLTAHNRGLEAEKGWLKLSQMVREFLSEMSLADFAGNKSTNVGKLRADSMSTRINTMFPPHRLPNTLPA